MMSNKELPIFTRVADDRITELEKQLAEATRLLNKDADWFDLNDQEQRADELRDRVGALLQGGGDEL